jgi:Protein of unknown function (DUF3540)
MNGNVIRLPRETEEHRGARVGPAEVVRGAAGVVEVVLANGDAREATVALASDYEPATGDTVLTISDGDGCWIIGVLAGSGRRTVTATGDLELHAGGKLRISADEGVEIEGPRLDVRVGVLTSLARSVTQRFDSLKQHVVELLSVQAGKMHTTVDGPSFVRAESATILTKENVNINGKAIHLG